MNERNLFFSYINVLFNSSNDIPIKKNQSNKKKMIKNKRKRQEINFLKRKRIKKDYFIQLSDENERQPQLQNMGLSRKKLMTNSKLNSKLKAKQSKTSTRTRENLSKNDVKVQEIQSKNNVKLKAKQSKNDTNKTEKSSMKSAKTREEHIIKETQSTNTNFEKAIKSLKIDNNDINIDSKIEIINIPDEIEMNKTDSINNNTDNKTNKNDVNETKKYKSTKKIPINNNIKSKVGLINNDNNIIDLSEGDVDIKNLVEEKIKKDVEKLNKINNKNRKNKKNVINKIDKRTKINEESTYIVNISRKKGIEPVYINEDIGELLKPHQIDGIRFLWKVLIEMEKDKMKGGILAHSMGLGKTFQIVVFSLLLFENSIINNMIIICPNSVLKNWPNEYMKWCEKSGVEIPNLYPMDETCKTNKKREDVIEEWGSTDKSILFITFNLFSILTDENKSKIDEKYRDLLLNTDFVVLDEGHKIKNKNAKITKSVMKLKTRKRIILTGTPMQNNLMEYWTMSNFIQPGMWDAKEFKSLFETPIKNGEKDDANELDKMIMKQRIFLLTEEMKPFLHRKDQSILKIELPPKHEYIISLNTTAFQTDLYEKFKECQTDQNELLYFCSITNKIISHPDLVKNFCKKKIEEKKNNNNYEWAESVTDDEKYVTEKIELSTKMKILFEIISYSLSINEKVAVFSQFTQNLDIIEIFIKKLGYLKKGFNYFRLDGSTVMKSREEQIQIFNKNEEANLFLISTKAGGTGINLTGSTRVVLFDVSWNPANDLQAVFRSYRYGQEKEVYIYRLISKNTFEEGIWKRCVSKTWLFETIVDDKKKKTLIKEKDFDFYKFSPKKESINVIKKNILNDDKLINNLIFKHGDDIIDIVEHESLFFDDFDATISELEKKKVMDEYKNRKDPLKNGFVNLNIPNRTNNINNINNIDNNDKKEKIMLPRYKQQQQPILLPNVINKLPTNINIIEYEKFILNKLKLSTNNNNNINNDNNINDINNDLTSFTNLEERFNISCKINDKKITEFIQFLFEKNEKKNEVEYEENVRLENEIKEEKKKNKIKKEKGVSFSDLYESLNK